MRAWQWVAVVGACLVMTLAGCARKESTFERAGREMDSALNQMSRDLDKSLNQR